MANWKLASVLLIAVIYITGRDCCSGGGGDEEKPDEGGLPEGVVAKGEKGSSSRCSDGALSGGKTCSQYKWACTSSRYPWFKGHCKKTCGGCGGSKVICGGHSASRCSECPQGNGASWCNGDCTWKRSTCVPKESSSSSNFAQSQLAKTNSYRAKHSAERLTIDSALTRDAQAYADKMARNNLWEHDQTTAAGENLFQMCASDSYPSGEGATDDWYSEEKNYNYGSGTSKGGMIGHFTQMVWKRSNGKFGIAKANGKGTGRNKYCTWVVARYSPAGNVIGRYPQNVNRP